MPTAAEDEVVELCRDLIRIDSSNPTSNERKAAEYVAERLEDVGLTTELIESEPGRASVVTRIEGADSSRGALLVHGHLDVVPADKSDWSVDPFAGVVKDGCVWGRGAVDMKNMDAMTLAVIREWMRNGTKPPRDIVLAFVADEEAGGVYGSHHLVDKRPELFDNCTDAISEVGGFSYSVNDDLRLYLIQTAEKGIAWMRLKAKGRAGHGSMVSDANAVTALARAVANIGAHDWPIRLTPTVTTFLNQLCEASDIAFDENDPKPALEKLGAMARIVGATLRNTANPTMLDAGYKVNVIPQTATAAVDGRFLPGYRDEFLATIDELIGPDVEREFIIDDIAVEAQWETDIVKVMCDALKSEDSGAQPVPYCMSGGTDAKAFSTLGMRCYGFSPLRLPPDLDFAGMFHGVDERVPVESLQFGVRVLDRFFRNC